MTDIVTFDLDSTLADTRHRHHLINADGDTDWIAYADHCEKDTLILPTAILWHSLQMAGATLAIVTARTDLVYDKTVRWLGAHNLHPSAMVMGSEGSDRADHCQLKVEGIRLVERLLGGEVRLHVDDYPPVAPALEAYGIPCLIVMSPQRIADPEFKTRKHISHV